MGLDFINGFTTTVDAERMTITFTDGDTQPVGTAVGLLPAFYQCAPFVPLEVGEFHTTVHRLTADLGGERMDLEYGEMPGILGLGLQAMGTDILIGGELLRKHRITFAPPDGKLFFETYH